MIPPIDSRKIDSLGVFCQYSTGEKQSMGLVVILAIFRRGKGMAGEPSQ
jgi:hypothetical protein